MFDCHKQLVTLCVLASLLLREAKSDFFTSTARLSRLLRTEGEVVRSLEQYLIQEEERLEKIKWLSSQFAKLHEAASDDVEKFITNPTNAYLLVKRLTADIETVNSLIIKHNNRAIISNVKSKFLHFPNEKDLRGAAEGLRRLQEMYLLNATAIALGKIKGSTLSAKLSAGDCFELGKQAYEANEINFTLQWMEEALNRLEEETEETANRTEIVEYMAYSAFVLKNYTYSIELNEYLLKLNPHHSLAQENVLYCKQLIEEEELKFTEESYEEKGQIIIKLDLKTESNSYPDFMKGYATSCRGESLKTPEEQSKLFCFYTTNNNNYLLLQPVKAEVLNLKPQIIVYHDILTDVETTIVKLLAAPRLERDKVSNATTGEDEFATYRISEGAGVHNVDHPLIPKLNRRIEYITGLSMDSAEMLDVINYGIGGHYEPHFDYAQPGDNVTFLSDAGNRIATWIFYLSHVPAGGSTVFPSIGVEVKPEKGSALFWYNLKRNGDGDPDTRHAACPVLIGSKWVGNKWIHEAGNEFRRTCSLDPSE